MYGAESLKIAACFVSANKTQNSTRLLFESGFCCIYSTRFTRFCVGLGTVNCDALAPQTKHKKTLWFYSDESLICILGMFLICLFASFPSVKLDDFNRFKMQWNYTNKLGCALAPRNPSATELHFACLIYTFHQVCMTFFNVKRQK